MNVYQNSDTFQKILRFGLQAIGDAIFLGFAVFFILAWLLTSPLLRLGDYLSDLYRLHATTFHAKTKEKL
jgi:hypothetical protein